MYHGNGVLAWQAIHAELLSSLRGLRADQVILKTLIPQGWTIPYLCDLVISDEFLTLPAETQIAVTQALKPEWVMARRTEIAALTQAEETRALTNEISGLKNEISKMTDLLGQVPTVVVPAGQDLKAQAKKAVASAPVPNGPPRRG